MDTILMVSKTSTTPDLQRIMLNLSDKANLKRSGQQKILYTEKYKKFKQEQLVYHQKT